MSGSQMVDAAANMHATRSAATRIASAREAGRGSGPSATGQCPEKAVGLVPERVQHFGELVAGVVRDEATAIGTASHERLARGERDGVVATAVEHERRAGWIGFVLEAACFVDEGDRKRLLAPPPVVEDGHRAAPAPAGHGA